MIATSFSEDLFIMLGLKLFEDLKVCPEQKNLKVQNMVQYGEVYSRLKQEEHEGM